MAYISRMHTTGACLECTVCIYAVLTDQDLVQNNMPPYMTYGRVRSEGHFQGHKVTRSFALLPAGHCCLVHFTTYCLNCRQSLWSESNFEFSQDG